MLAYVGNTRDHHSVLLVHIVVSLVAVVVVFVRRENLRWAAIAGAAAALVLVAGVADRKWVKGPEGIIVNTRNVPVSMDEEGGRPEQSVFSSRAQTRQMGRLCRRRSLWSRRSAASVIKTFMSSGRVRLTILRRSTISTTGNRLNTCRGVVGHEAEKWCAGCHDHAVFFNGRFDKPIKDQIDTPEAQAGLSCMSCHSIVHVNGSVGNAGFHDVVSATA